MHLCSVGMQMKVPVGLGRTSCHISWHRQEIERGLLDEKHTGVPIALVSDI